MKTWLAILDRTAVLFLGLAAGAAIGFAFADGRDPAPVAAGRAVAPPPPAAAAGPATAASTPPTAAGPDCAVPFHQHLLHAVAAGDPVRIGVFGDSFGDGVWSGLQQQLRQRQGYEVVKFSRQATGFTRYRSLDLEAHTAEQLADRPVDIAVVSFGANDTQGVIADGHLAKLMSPAWQTLIGARVDRLVALLRARGAIVYWVGLPRMRKPEFDADISAMNAFYERRMAALRVPFIDPRPIASPDGFVPYLRDPRTGKETLMRANDGVHMSMTGYVWITRGLADRIRAHVAAARRLAPPPPPAAPPAIAA